MNIFLFTFILGWYTEFSIFDAKESFNKRNREGFSNDNDNNDNKSLRLNILSIKKESSIFNKVFWLQCTNLLIIYSHYKM